MTNLKLQSTVYSISNAGSNLDAEGSATVSSNLIQNVNLRFTDASGKEVGYVNYSESASGSNYNYSIRSDEYKDEVRNMSDEIISDVKTQLIKA